MKSQLSLAMAVILTVATSLLNAGQPKLEAQRLDGHWWLFASSFEQDGFMKGYLDCWVFEAGDDGDLAQQTVGRRTQYHLQLLGQTDEHVKRITRWYKANLGAWDQPVGEVLHRFLAARAEGPEGDAYGTRDGMLWMSMGYYKHMADLGESGVEATRMERIGFIEGYLWCHAARVKDADGTFSESPEQYASLISQWYKVDENTGEVTSDQWAEPIANVLHRFRDGSPALEMHTHPGKR